ncbi:MAG: site-2 protease family protein [Oscillospiraceae bacterium]|nr:site-2 protease family protein [Oscillospiraceae bacterium]
MTILIAVISVILFLLIIVIHELGHFFAAKACDVKVNEFAIGMGPKILKYQGKETLYTLKLFPIGGACYMEGEDSPSGQVDEEEASDTPKEAEKKAKAEETTGPKYLEVFPRAFCNKKIWQRAIILAAGAVLNILLGFVLMGVVTAQEKEAYTSTIIAGFGKGAVSNAEGGLQVGDKIIAVNGYSVYCAQDLGMSLQMDAGKPMDFKVVRDGKKLNLKQLSFKTEQTPKWGKVTIVDFYVEGIPKTFGSFISQTFNNTISYTRSVYETLFRLITGRLSATSVSGPVGIAEGMTQATSQSYQAGMSEGGFGKAFANSMNTVLNILAIITVNLGVMNLLPIPALDGGRLLFLIIEGIRCKPIKNEGMIHFIGFALLMVLILLVTFKDIIHLFK